MKNGTWINHIRICLRGAPGTWIVEGLYAHPIGEIDNWLFYPVNVVAGNDNNA